MILPRTVSAMNNIIFIYHLNVISLNPIDKKAQKQIGNPKV